MTYAALFIAGFLVGSIIFAIISSKDKPVGVLYVDYSDPEEAYLFTDLYVDPNAIAQMKQATFDVKVKNFVSHK